MQRISRISYNSSNWQRPTGDAHQSESPGTFNAKYGFGYEDWLFRNEWIINGWRYAFIQGVSRSRQKLVKDSQSMELTLFTIDPNKRRKYVAIVRNAECLDDEQAKDAFAAYERLGWYPTMRDEISSIGGVVAEFDASTMPWNFVNVRFRLSDVTFLPSNFFAKPNDPVCNYSRYQLYKFAAGRQASTATVNQRIRGSHVPSPLPYLRGQVAAVQCTPEHARMQATLLAELQCEYPADQVVPEQDFVDIKVTTKTEIILFEIKTAIQPQLVIREALGQILEYAYHPMRQYHLPVRLMIVGRRPLTEPDERYLERLRTTFQLPLFYRMVAV